LQNARLYGARINQHIKIDSKTIFPDGSRCQYPDNIDHVEEKFREFTTSHGKTTSLFDQIENF
jgi:hypothetical protein